MQLKLLDPNKFVDVAFGKWLIRHIQVQLLTNIDTKKLLRWDKYLTESNKIPRLYNKQYRAEDFIIIAVNNLICTGTDGEIVIKINPVIMAPGLDRIKLVDLMRLINYGNIQQKGYPLFSDTFREVSNSINSYLQSYYKL